MLCNVGKIGMNWNEEECIHYIRGCTIGSVGNGLCSRTPLPPLEYLVGMDSMVVSFFVCPSARPSTNNNRRKRTVRHKI